MPVIPQNKRAWLWPLFGAAIAAFAGFHLLSRKIVYIVPNNYSGIVTIVKDERGANLWPSLRGLVIEVPSSGVVRMRSIGLLNRWSITRAYEKSGVELPVSILGRQASGRRFWLMNSNGHNLYCFVGSETELVQLIKQRSGAKPNTSGLDL